MRRERVAFAASAAQSSRSIVAPAQERFTFAASITNGDQPEGGVRIFFVFGPDLVLDRCITFEQFALPLTELRQVREADRDGDLLAEEEFQEELVAGDLRSGRAREPLAQDIGDRPR